MTALLANTARPGVVGRQALADNVYQEIFSSLVDGRLSAGAGISIDRVARDLMVSPTPVREALARLEATGLVLRVALKGYRAAPVFTRAELIELMDARLFIEPLNAMRACQRATPELINALELSVMDLHAPAPDVSSVQFHNFCVADEEFHALIAQAGANRFILAAYHSLGGQIQRFRFFTGLGATDADHAVKEHTRILDAFRAGDPEGARDAMTAHLQSVKQRSIRGV